MSCKPLIGSLNSYQAHDDEANDISFWALNKHLHKNVVRWTDELRVREEPPVNKHKRMSFIHTPSATLESLFNHEQLSKTTSRIVNWPYKSP